MMQNIVLIAATVLLFTNVQGDDEYLTEKPENVTTYPGQQIIIKCVFNVTPKQTCYWTHNGEHFKPNGTTSTQGDCSLTIPDVQLKDGGQYTCGYPGTGSSDGYIFEPPATVTILVQPESIQLKYKDKYISNGDPLRITDKVPPYHVNCEVGNGNPAAKISWFIDSVPQNGHETISNGSKEYLLNTTSEIQIQDPNVNLKFISCNASHQAYNSTGKMESTEAMIIIKGPVTIVTAKFSNRTETVPSINVGEYIQMVCIAYSEPDSIFMWQMRERGSNDWKMLQVEPNAHQINIQPDDGYYRCGAMNDEMSQYQYSNDLEVEVIYPPETLKSGVIIGTVIITVSFFALAIAIVYNLHRNKQCCFKRGAIKSSNVTQELSTNKEQEVPMLEPNTKNETGEEKVVVYAVLDFDPSETKLNINTREVLHSSESVNYATIQTNNKASK